MTLDQIKNEIFRTWNSLQNSNCPVMQRPQGCQSHFYLMVGPDIISFLLLVGQNVRVNVREGNYTNASVSRVSVSQNDDAIEVKLTNKGFYNTFGTIASDVAAAIYDETDPNVYVPAFAKRVNNWINLFKRRGDEILSVEKQVGLYGELLLIQNLINDGKDECKVVDAWVGPEGGDKDFLLDSLGIEVKSSVRGDKIVKISNVQQLDPLGLTHLYLYHFIFAKVEGGNNTLPHIVDSLRNRLAASPILSAFENKLLMAGYQDAHRTRYTTSFNSRDEICYEVNNNFPKIIRSNMMPGVIDASYDLDLNTCTNNEVTYQDFLSNIN